MDVELETIPNQVGTAVLCKADGKILKVLITVLRRL
jgi:hypothetical protein